jgi:accessory gene regulator protein AgrB
MKNKKEESNLAKFLAIFRVSIIKGSILFTIVILSAIFLFLEIKGAVYMR